MCFVKGQPRLRWDGIAAQMQPQIALQTSSGFSYGLFISVTLGDFLKSLDTGDGFQLRHLFPGPGGKTLIPSDKRIRGAAGKQHLIDNPGPA